MNVDDRITVEKWLESGSRWLRVGLKSDSLTDIEGPSEIKGSQDQTFVTA